MPLSFDDEILQIECPRCGTKITESGRWFRKGGSTCPSCEAATATNPLDSIFPENGSSGLELVTECSVTGRC
jgi:hypothetical protein